jgi:hypothetical protein
MRPRSPHGIQLDQLAGFGGRRAPSAVLRREHKTIRRWMVRVRCLTLGHRWRESNSLHGYLTCARCHVRRLPTK